jgi:hypothetical protein
MRFQVEHLLLAAGDSPIVSVTRKPLDLGTNLPQDGQRCYWSIYLAMLKAAKHASTPYVAMAEDDVLYTAEHFSEFRPHGSAVAFDLARWNLYTWHPLFHANQHRSNATLIASRSLLIEAIEERVAKWPNGPGNLPVGEIGRPRADRALGVQIRPSSEWYCSNPIVHLHHPSGTDNGDFGVTLQGRKLIKPIGKLKAIEIPYWGAAKEIVSHYG